jgi:ACT domain-containing protein
VHTFVLRVSLPDRPGALGAVASRIGAVRGDVVAVEIVEREEGRAVDEFVVELVDEENLPLLLNEIAEVDGVSVQEAHPVAGGVRDRRLDAYDTASLIVAQRTPQDVIAALTTRTCQELDALWASVVDVEQCMLIASEGPTATAAWITDYVVARRQGHAPTAGKDEEILWIDLAAWDLVLIVAREGWKFGVRETDRLAALARLADERWIDVSEHEARPAARGVDVEARSGRSPG